MITARSYARRRERPARRSGVRPSPKSGSRARRNRIADAGDRNATATSAEKPSHDARAPSHLLRSRVERARVRLLPDADVTVLAEGLIPGSRLPVREVRARRRAGARRVETPGAAAVDELRDDV